MLKKTLKSASSLVLISTLGVSQAHADTWSSLGNGQATQPAKNGAAQGSTSSNPSPALSTSASQMLFNEIEVLKQELQRLQGVVEEQGYELKKLKTEQKERYLDLDRRLGQVAKGSPASEKASAGEGKQAYTAAFELMKQQKLDDAAQSFTAFLSEHPKSPLVVNGYYWLGQIYYNQGKLDEARQAFTIVVNQYPDHQKSADSTYKLGVVLHRLGDTVKAKQLLEAVKVQYPNSASSRFAAKYLKENF